MSIFPKKLIKGKDKFTTFHMKICNYSNKNIEGKINYKIIRPDNKIDEIHFDRIERINSNSELDKYDKYYINNNFPIGRYYVEGRFLWNGKNILSQTNENDFFDVEDY